MITLRGFGVLLASVFVVQAHGQTSRPVFCAPCHPNESAAFAKSAMGRSLAPAEPLANATILSPRAGARITIEQRNGRMIHRLSEQGLTAEYPVRYQVGAGIMGRTYLVEVGPYLFESPASFFKRYGWDLSPGYAAQQSIDFDRVIDDQCLSCHTGGAQFMDADRHRLRDTNLSAITCDRCHGSTAAHLQHPSRNNIVNPARLTGPERDSVCEQCHLEGTTRIANPGKTFADFKVGQPAEATFATYLLHGNTSDVMAVSQAEQLAQSQCWRSSGGKLWCGSCHNPHRETAERQAEIRRVCLGCHVSLSPAAHPTPPAECTSCHMPANPTTDIPHAAVTDHRLRRRPTPAPTAKSELSLEVWREPAPEFRTRDRALADVLTGFQKNAPALWNAGIDLLNGLPEDQTARDPEVLSDLEGLAMQSHNATQSIHIGQTLTALRPESAKYAMNFGIVLKQAGHLGQAQEQLQRAIQLDESLRQAYAELASLYAASGDTVKALATLERYLQFNPQDVQFRLRRAQLQAAPAR